MIKTAYTGIKKTIFNLDAGYIFHGGFWLTLSQIVSVAVVILTSYVFANYVDVADYGAYKYIISLSVIFSLLSLTGMAQSVMQAASRGYTSFLKVGFRKSLLYGLTTTVIGFAASLYYAINGDMPLSVGCALIATLIPFTYAGQLIYSVLQGQKQFNVTAKLQIIRTLITGIAIIGTIFLTENIVFYIGAYFVSNALLSMGIYLYTKKRIVPDDSNATEANYKKYISYAKHSSARDILNGLAYEVDKILAFQLFGATQLAIYAFAIAIPEQLKGIFKNLALLILVRFTGYSIDSIKKDLMKKVFLLGILLLILTVGYVLIAPFIYHALFPNYTDSIFLSQIFALSFLPMVAIFPLSALQSQMREKDLHTLNISTALLLIGSAYFSITHYGLLGLIVSRVFVRYANCIATFWLLYRK